MKYQQTVINGGIEFALTAFGGIVVVNVCTGALPITMHLSCGAFGPKISHNKRLTD
jgi:hypothetical protein